MTLETLLLLQRVLDAQQLHVGDPDFDSLAPIVWAAKEELRQAIEAASAKEKRDAHDALTG